MIVALCVFFQAEDGIRDLVRSRGLGDVYKRQVRCSGRAGSRNGLRREEFPGKPGVMPVYVVAEVELSLIHI